MKCVISLFITTIGLALFSSVNATGQRVIDQEQIKATIISIQRQIVDLTDPLQPFYCDEFFTQRKHISKDTGNLIVSLIKNGQLTDVQSEIGIGLLTGLPETNYWDVTTILLSTNTSEDVLNSVLLMPLPYGPCYADAYKNEEYTAILGELRSNTTSERIKGNLDFILSGDAAKAYREFLKDPQRYGYFTNQINSTLKPLN